MDRKQSSKKDIIVAIDFGTRNTGWSYAFTNRPNEVLRNKPKIKTDVVLDKKDEVVKFGDDAEKFFVAKRHHENYQHLRLFTRFKMSLYEAKSEPLIKDTDGKPIKAIALFAAVLSHLRGLIAKEMREALGREIPVQSILWVLTIPAIWNDASKEIMRTAARNARLFEDEASLLLALEPEAASFACRRAELSTKPMEAAELEPLCIVLDGGAGTFDTIIHKLTVDNKMKEVYAPQGGPWGGTKIDDAFVQLLDQIFTSQIMSSYKAKFPLEWLELMCDFEVLKQTVDPAAEDEGYIRVGGLARHLQENGMRIEECLDKFNKLQPQQTYAPGEGKEYDSLPLLPGVEGKVDSSEGGEEEFINVQVPQGTPVGWTGSGKLTLSHQVLIGLFKNTINSIRGHLKQLLATPACSKLPVHIYLVGGFGESPVLYRAVQEEIAGRKNASLVRPPQPSLAVLTGATLFGLAHSTSDGVVISRAVKKSIGIEICREWKLSDTRADRVPSRKSQRGFMVELCTNVFDSWVKQGQEVGVNESMSRVYNPTEDGQRAVSINLYQSDGRPDYVDDPECRRIGSLQLEMPDQSGGLDRSIKVEMLFGGTEIAVKATDLTSGNQCRSKLTFLDQGMTTLVRS